jgi:phage gpG-like protein
VIHIRIDADAIRAALGGGAKRVRDNAPAFRVIATRLRQSILKNFRMGGWYPEPWPKSVRAQAVGGKTLIDRAILRNSMYAKSAANFAAAGTAVPYAHVHQFGAVIRAKTPRGLVFRIGEQWVRKHEVTIPARPFLPVREGKLHPEDGEYIVRTLREWIVGGEARG